MEKYFIAAINSVDQIGARRMAQLLKYFGSAQEAWIADEAELLKSGLPMKAVTFLIKMRTTHPHAAEEIMERCEQKDIRICCVNDEDYPILLKKLPDAPPILYYRGMIQPDVMRIAVVGTRRMSTYGKQATLEVAEDLANSGITIVSGGANGIDTFAHQGALKFGRTVAVLGCGIEVVYPPNNRQLFEQIVENGAIVSEYPPLTPPKPGQFPQRNRIIAGLSRGVVVMEAGERSGALNTAQHAGEYNRDVFALPGSIYAERSRGCNLLIRDGAILIRNAADILETYHFTDRAIKIKRKLEPLTDDEAEIFALIPDQTAISTEEILMRADEMLNYTLTTQKLLVVLNALELKGYVMEDVAHSYLRTLISYDAAPFDNVIKTPDDVERVLKEKSAKRSSVKAKAPSDSLISKWGTLDQNDHADSNHSDLDPNEEMILSVITDAAMSEETILYKVDEISEQPPPIKTIRSALTSLIAKDYIDEDAAGNYFRRTRR